MRFRSSTLLASLLGCLSALLGFESSLSARPRPKGPTPLDQRLEAWAQHRSLEESSDFRGLPWRCVGPVVQGGRLVGRVQPFMVSPGIPPEQIRRLGFTPFTTVQDAMDEAARRKGNAARVVVLGMGGEICPVADRQHQ
jgi:hypothetical protein